MKAILPIIGLDGDFAACGSMRRKLLSADRVLAAFGPVSGDSTKLLVGDVVGFANRPVGFRFTVEQGTLYSFWVSRDKSGKSGGYLAGGGPGYRGYKDE